MHCFSWRKNMRYAFITPEDFFIEKIAQAIEKISENKSPYNKSLIAKKEIEKILLHAKNKLLKVKEKARNLNSVERAPQLHEIWREVIEATAQHTHCLNLLNNIHNEVTQYLPESSSSREEAINELIANYAAANDNGASQANLQARILPDVMVTTALAVLQLPTLDQQNPELRQICFQNAMHQTLQTLRASGDEDFIRMEQNQEAAYQQLIDKIILLQNKAQELCTFELRAANAWQAFEDELKYYQSRDKKAEEKRFYTMIDCIKTTIENLTDTQKKYKVPLNHFSLKTVLTEILEGQKTLFDQFHQNLIASQKLILKISELTGTEDEDLLEFNAAMTRSDSGSEDTSDESEYSSSSEESSSNGVSSDESESDDDTTAIQSPPPAAVSSAQNPMGLFSRKRARSPSEDDSDAERLHQTRFQDKGGSYRGANP